MCFSSFVEAIILHCVAYEKAQNENTRNSNASVTQHDVVLEHKAQPQPQDHNHYAMPWEESASDLADSPRIRLNWAGRLPSS